MVVVAVILAVVVWTLTLVYWLTHRRRPGVPPTFEQLNTRIAELESRLRESQEENRRRAVEDARARLEREQAAAARRRRAAPAPSRNLIDEVESLFTDTNRTFTSMLRDLLPNGGHATWTIRTETTETPAQAPQAPAPPAAPTRPARPTPPTAQAQPDPPVHRRSVYERLRDPWPTNDPPETENPRPQAAPSKTTTS